MLNTLLEETIIRAVFANSFSAGDIVLSAEGEMQGIAVTDGLTGDIKAVLNGGVVCLPTTDVFLNDYDRVYMRTADRVIVSSPLSVLVASDVTAALDTGGTLSDDEYFYAITVSDGYGESVIGVVDSATVSGSYKTIDLSWTAVIGAVSYNIYRGTAADDLYYLDTVSAPVVIYTDDGSVSPTTATTPDYNSTGTQYIGRYLAGYVGTIPVCSTLRYETDGSITKVEAYMTQKWVTAGSIPVLLKLT